MQTRAREVRSGVAGKPTTTAAMPRSRVSREKDAILPGWYSMMGCEQEHFHRHINQPAIVFWHRPQRAGPALGTNLSYNTIGVNRNAKRSSTVTYSTKPTQTALRVHLHPTRSKCVSPAACHLPMRLMICRRRTMTGESRSPSTLSPISCSFSRK